MRTLLYNGKIYLDAERFAEALLVEDTKILKVGSNIELFPYILDANAIDLQGRTVLPGFNDSHLHLYGCASFMSAVNLYACSSIDELVARSNAFIAAHDPSEDTLIGRGWNQDFFRDEVRLPNRYDLDRISTDRAVVFPRACGHIVALNSKALHMAHIDQSTINPDGGAIDKDENGEPTGILRENALNLIDALYPEISVNEMLRRLREVALRANSLGITSVQTNDLHIGDVNSQHLEEAYRLFAEDKVLKVYHQVCFDDIQTFMIRISEGFIDVSNPYNRYGCLKLFADGSLGARTAAMKQPYADDPSTYGIAILSPDTLDDWIQTADNAGIQVAVHAIGDRAIRDVLDAFTKVCNGKNGLRHGIIHCQITDEGLLRSFQKQDILAYVQPVFLHYDLHIVQQRVGKELAETSYAFQTMEDLMIHTAYGTDAPVEDFNPFENIYCAITRKDLGGYPENGFNPKEKVDLATAIDAYTLGGAYASFEEHHKGRLYEGYDADLIVVDKPVFDLDEEEIRSITIDLTMVDGMIVYEK